MIPRMVWAITVVIVATVPVHAGGKTKLAQEAAELVLRKFGKETVDHGLTGLAQRIERLALKHGDDVIAAAKKTGPQGLKLIEESGEHAARAATTLARHGPHAVTVVSRPSALKLIGQHGDLAGDVFMKHPGVAEPLVEKLGKPAVEALAKVGTSSARRVAMLGEGETAHVVAHPGFLNAVAKFGDRLVEFCWKHRLALASTAVLAAVLHDPEPYLDGTLSLAELAAENVAKPLAHSAGRSFEHAVEKTVAEITPEIARRTDWTWVFLGLVAAVSVLILPWFRRRRMPSATTAT